MTQKELLYIEDAIGHEKCILSNLYDINNCLSDEDLKDFIKKEIKMHQKINEDFLKLLKEKANE